MAEPLPPLPLSPSPSGAGALGSSHFCGHHRIPVRPPDTPLKGAETQGGTRLTGAPAGRPGDRRGWGSSQEPASLRDPGPSAEERPLGRAREALFGQLGQAGPGCTLGSEGSGSQRQPPVSGQERPHPRRITGLTGTVAIVALPHSPSGQWPAVPTRGRKGRSVGAAYLGGTPGAPPELSARRSPCEACCAPPR